MVKLNKVNCIVVETEAGSDDSLVLATVLKDASDYGVLLKYVMLGLYRISCLPTTSRDIRFIGAAAIERAIAESGDAVAIAEFAKRKKANGDDEADYPQAWYEALEYCLSMSHSGDHIYGVTSIEINGEIVKSEEELVDYVDQIIALA